MSSGPSIVLVLERDDAIAHLRDVMGATDFTKADDGTIRKEFATSIEANIIHGSDSPESAAIEIPYFFNALELHPR
jgi:nucleoside-diphosphate kinase